MNRLACVVTLVALLPAPLLAADHSNLEEGLPIETADAKPLGYLGREFQSIFRYEESDDGVDSFVIETRLEIGFPRNAQISIAQPWIMGEVEPDGIGNTTLEFFYNFNQETLSVPAFAVATGLEFDTMEEADGVDPFVNLIASKTIGDSWMFHQVHVNFYYQANDDVQPGERGGRYRASIAYSRRLNNQALLLVDFVREQEMEEDVEHNLVEAGVRYQLTPNVVLSGGAGVGIGDESPDVRGIFGVQFSF